MQDIKFWFFPPSLVECAILTLDLDPVTCENDVTHVNVNDYCRRSRWDMGRELSPKVLTGVVWLSTPMNRMTCEIIAISTASDNNYNRIFHKPGNNNELASQLCEWVVCKCFCHACWPLKGRVRVPHKVYICTLRYLSGEKLNRIKMVDCEKVHSVWVDSVELS